MIWTAICMAVWYAGGDGWGAAIGLPLTPEDAEPIVGVHYFWTPDLLWFYIYYTICVLLFGAFWRIYQPHPWLNWSIFGSAIIIFVTYFSVQASVALNNWRRPFYDLIQEALSKAVQGGNSPEEAAHFSSELYRLALVFLAIAMIYIAIAVGNRFFVSHYIFRWRTAMNDYYTSQWPRLRKIEGASQRVQEDTMRFAETMESLAVSAIDSVMTLIAFLPILYTLSSNVTALPIVGEVPAPLVMAAIFWSLFGTVLLATVGIRLPGLYFQNQRVEAAFRKELVYGEDHPDRAQPITLRDLFSNVRHNYFRLYTHYAYFNVARYFYLQADAIFPTIILVPSIAAGRITFGIFQQVVSAFNQVSNSFQYLVNSWGTIIELISIYKRLQAFEASMDGRPLSEIEREAMETQVGPHFQDESVDIKSSGTSET